MNRQTRRALLRMSPAAALAFLAGCTALGIGTTGTVTTAPLASALQLFENALAAAKAALPSTDPLIATIEADITTVEGEIAAGLTTPTVSTMSLLETVASALLGLLPMGGTLVTIGQAILALLSGLGVTLVRPAARTAAQAMTFAQAQAYLATLPTYHKPR